MHRAAGLLSLAVTAPCAHSLCATPAPPPVFHHHRHPWLSTLAPPMQRVSVAQLRMRGGGTAVPGGAAASGAVEVRLDVGGMKCGGCAGRVRTLLEEEDGVLKVAVSLPAAMAVVSLDQGGDASTLVQKLLGKGFNTQIAQSGVGTMQAHAERRSRKAAECRVLSSAVRVILLLNLPSIAFMLAPAASEAALWWILQKLALQMVVSLETARGYIGLAQASVALLTVGKRFYRSSFEAVRAGFANMDVLITLGVTTNFAFSAATMTVTLNRCHLMFDTQYYPRAHTHCIKKETKKGKGGGDGSVTD